MNRARELMPASNFLANCENRFYAHPGKNATFCCGTHAWGGWILMDDYLVFAFFFSCTHHCIHTSVILWCKPAVNSKSQNETEENLKNLKIQQCEYTTMMTMTMTGVGKHCMTVILIARHRRACTTNHTSRNGISPLRWEVWEALIESLSYLS